MKKLISLLLSLCLCFSMLTILTACDEVAKYIPDAASTLESLQGTGQESNEQQPNTLPQPEAASPVLHADITSEELLGGFDIIHTFGDDKIENYTLWCEVEMTDFYIVGLNPDTENWTTNGVRLFEKAKLGTNEAINYKRMVPEGFPSDAIVYTANGDTYMYAVSFNGRDGGISLIEIDQLTIAEAKKTKKTEKSTTAKSTKSTTTTKKTTKNTSKEICIEVYWVGDDLDLFAMERTIESDSKWHVWKAIKACNKKKIPSKCSLISGEKIKGRNGVMVLDFSSEFEDVSNSMNGRIVLQAIANTYITVYDLNAIRFKVDGEYVDNAICGYAEEFGYTEC